MPTTKHFQESQWWKNAVQAEPAKPAMSLVSTSQPGATTPEAPHSKPVKNFGSRAEFASYIVDYFREMLMHLSGGTALKLENQKLLRQALRVALESVTRESPLARMPDFDAEIAKVRASQESFLDHVFGAAMGFGPLEPFLSDPEVREIMVNGARNVLVERRGTIVRTNVTFQSDQQVYDVINRILAPLDKEVDAEHPMMDARLPDGSRVNVIIPPVSLVGPAITIRKFPENPLGMDDLIKSGSISEQAALFIKACVEGRLNIIVSGNTGSGKTTLLNVLGRCVPDRERIVTIEDTAELQINKPDWLPLEARVLTSDGKGDVNIRELVRNALRMRPDRIIIGECRGGEALDMLQAMNTGHDGSMTTCHANSPRDLLSRLEVMVLMAGMQLPVEAIHRQIGGAIQIIVQTERLEDGTRRVNRITEVEGCMDGMVVFSDLFTFQQQGVASDGNLIGKLTPTGIRPKFGAKLANRGVELTADMFDPGNETPSRVS